MALALQRAGPLKPEIRLAQALSEFEAILSDDDKRTFRIWRLGKPPAVSDVMKLTAEIDKNNSRRMSRRCFGPRLTNILEAVQQFSTVLDVIIGGTQSPIATSIWGVLRMTLQIAAKFASYFDNLSALFMRIGRSCPRYQEYGLMYPKSLRLQDALCEYFCTVAHMCKKAVLFIRKPLVAQLSAAILNPFQSEFGPLEVDLSTMAETIREEASLTFKQEVGIEKREASNFRALFSSKTLMEIEEAKKFKRWKAKLRFLTACSTYNHQTAWKRARKAGASARIFDQAAYMQWLHVSTSSVLWFTGILGSGKTVLTASVVQEIVIKYPDAFVCYFFCTHDDAESLRARTIIGSLARQLLSLLNPDAFDSIDVIKLSTLDDEVIVAYLLRFLSRNEQYFVIVDGLDECTEIELSILFDCLDKFLKSNRRFHIFCSSRPDLHARYQATLQPQTHLSLSELNPEIAEYIDNTLADRLAVGSLSLGDPTMILAIRDALLERNHGMFLWVVFQLDSICAEITDEAILNALQSLPKDLPETFARILRKLGEKRTTSPDICRKIFALVAAAQRPLTLDELREAMSVVPGNTEWDPRKLINDMRMTVSACGSLLLVDEEDSTVRFSHHSVRQYIISTPQDACTHQYHVDLPEANLNLGEICVTYLNFDIFNTTLTKISKGAALQPQDIASSIVEKTLPQTAVRKIALKLLKGKGRRDFDLEARLKEMTAKGRKQEEHAFLPYAKEFWLFHTQKFDEGKLVTYKLWLDIVSGSVNTVMLPWAFEPWCGQAERYLDWLMENEHEALLLETISSITRSRPDLAQRAFSSVFELSAQRLETERWSSYLAKLLPRFFDEEAIFSLLVENGANVNFICPNGDTVLMKAVHEGRTQAVKLLLGRKDLEINKILTGRTILTEAVLSGNEEIVRLLLTRSDIEINTGDDRGPTPLFVAWSNGQEEMVKLLLGRDNLDVNSRDKNGQTALHRAAIKGNQKFLNLLLARDDIDVNIGDDKGRTPLMTAQDFMRDGTVKLLLAREDLNVNLSDEDGQTALHRAARKKDEKWLDSLLDRDDINTEVRDLAGNTPLDVALEVRHPSIEALQRRSREAHRQAT